MGFIHEGRRRRGVLRVAAASAVAVVALAAAGPAAVAGSSDASGSTFVLTDFDFDTRVVSASNAQFSLASPYDPETWFLAAKLDRYIPTDPCREAAIQYNDAIATAVGFDSQALDFALEALADRSCHARVIINGPHQPGDPHLPPSPIRQFEPRALPPSPI